MSKSAKIALVVFLCGILLIAQSPVVRSASSSTVGQVLRVTGALTYAFGAVDLANSNAVSGLLSEGNVDAAIMRDSELAAATVTKTNMTYDAAGTGNNLTYIDKKYLTAAGCSGTTGTGAFDLPTSNAATTICIGTTTTTAFLVYADGSTQVSTIHHRLPDDWASANFAVKLSYTGSVSSTSTIDWRVSTACTADDGDPTSPSYNATSTNSAAGPTTTPQLKTTTFSSLALTNCAAGEMMHIKIEKVTGDAYTGSGYLLAAELAYTRTQ